MSIINIFVLHYPQILGTQLQCRFHLFIFVPLNVLIVLFLSIVMKYKFSFNCLLKSSFLFRYITGKHVLIMI